LLQEKQATDVNYLFPRQLVGVIIAMVAGAEDAAKAKRSA